MNSSAALFALLALIAGAQPAAVGPAPLQLTQLDLFRSAVGLRGAPLGVGGIISCGHAGEIVDVGFTDCEAVPCRAVVGNSYRVDVDFKPSVSHGALHLEIMLLHLGEYHPVFDAEVPDSAVEGGVEYKFGYTLRFTDAYMGSARLAFRLFGPGSPMDEICFMVLLNIVDP